MRHRLATILVATTLVAAACGSDGDDATGDAPNASIVGGAGGDTSSAPSAPGPTEPASSDSTAPDATDGSGSDADADVDADEPCRQLVHELGTACVPADPQRIVVLDPLMALPTLLDLGVAVHGSAAVYDAGDPFPDYIDASQTEGIEIAGSMASPNVEAVAALDPDLIIGTERFMEPIYEQLAEIAPAVATPYAFYSSDWLPAAAMVAEAVGRDDEFVDLVAELDAHVAETAAALAERGAPLTLTRVDVYQGTPLYYRFDCLWLGDMFAEVGIEQPPAQQDACTDGDYATTIVYPSLEELDVLDADAVVAYQQQSTADDLDADPLTALTASPLWAQLAAVQDDAVYVVGDAWGLGVSTAAAHVILDDLVDVVFPAQG